MFVLMHRPYLFVIVLYFLCYFLHVFYIACLFVFFFKQKTAYEMRISDWSSDVCSSDLPPGAPNLFGPLNGQVWTITTQSQNRPQVRSVSFDPATGIEVSRTGFADKHVIDRVVGVGIAWHEGQLFGWINQLIGVLTAAALFTLAVSGFLLWRRRKPIDTRSEEQTSDHQ